MTISLLFQVTHYRFGVSWPRIIPNPANGGGEVNPLGIRYYKNLISALKLVDIEPVVTLFHWNTPMVLEDAGGEKYYHSETLTK